MYICICKAVTDAQIRQAVFDGSVLKPSHLKTELGAGSQCGKCAVEAKKVVRTCLNELKLLDESTAMPA